MRSVSATQTPPLESTATPPQGPVAVLDTGRPLVFTKLPIRPNTKSGSQIKAGLVGALLGKLVGAFDGALLGVLVGESVGALVGELLGASVGELEGSIGKVLGAPVGKFVGVLVGELVGAAVEAATVQLKRSTLPLLESTR